MVRKERPSCRPLWVLEPCGQPPGHSPVVALSPLPHVSVHGAVPKLQPLLRVHQQLPRHLRGPDGLSELRRAMHRGLRVQRGLRTQHQPVRPTAQVRL